MVFYYNLNGLKYSFNCCLCAGNGEKKSAGTEIEAAFLNGSDFQRSLYSSPKLITSSLCQETDSFSNRKATSVSTEWPSSSDFIPSTTKLISVTQETQAEGSYTQLTRPKETDSDYDFMQHQNESTTSPTIDLQEDFDCVEQSLYHILLFIA